MVAGEQADREQRPTEAEEIRRKALAGFEQSGPDDWRAAWTLERLAHFYAVHDR
jgi:hypothetical protein